MASRASEARYENLWLIDKEVDSEVNNAAKPASLHRSISGHLMLSLHRWRKPTFSALLYVILGRCG
jgi:hypothetical protein